MVDKTDFSELERLQAEVQDLRARLARREEDWERAEGQRRYYDQLFTAAFDASPEAISLSRFEDSVLVDVNEEWLRLTGYRREEVIGHSLVELGLETDRQDQEAARRQLSDLGRLHELETVVFLRGKGKRLIRCNGALIDIDGQRHLLMYLSDRTSQRMAEESVRSGEQALALANEKLSSQVELYDVMESLARVGHWTASPDGQRIVWSRGLQLIAGDPPEAPGERSSPAARSHIHPDDQALFLAARQAMDGRVFEYRFIHPSDGRTVWLRTRMLRHRNADGGLTDIGVLQDVSIEHMALAAQREKLEFIEKLTSRVPDVLYQYQRHADGRITFPFISESVRRVFQLDPEVVRSDARQLFAVIEKADLPALFESMRLAYRDGGTFQHEFRVHHPDGSVHWVRGNSITLREPDGMLASYGALRDITDTKTAETRLQESEARFRSLTDLSSDWYWEIDEHFRFTHFAGYREGRSIVTRTDSIGKTRWELGALNLGPEEWDAHKRILEAHQPFRDFELQRLDALGEVYWVSVSGVPVFDASGEFRGYRGIGRDITPRKLAENETQRLAFYDTLTGLPNRRLLMDRLGHAQITSSRSRCHGALLFIDLDNFKDLNDTLGHDVGDQLLEQVALRLVSCLREGDTAARFGGDEFVVMLEDLSIDAEAAAAQAERVGEKILARLNAPYELVGRQHNSSPSIGVTLFCGLSQTVDELLKRADLAMYQAKGAGRNTLRFFDPQMQAAVLSRAALDADLRLALQRDELLLHYQPFVDQRGHIVGYEALLRWRHAQRGLVSPGEFIALAEQSGLILPMGQWVLRTACRQLVDWARDPGTRHLGLSVNVSARQFRQAEFVSDVLSVIDETGADPQRLKLELTESLLISDVEDAIRKMGQLRDRGVRFALDDFGTGYSSLSYLKRLPLDQIKIDQAFVRGVLTDANNAAIVRTILALAQSMELQAVAEGVEHEGQRRFLLDNGCQVFQGYLFGRPGPFALPVMPA